MSSLRDFLIQSQSKTTVSLIALTMIALLLSLNRLRGLDCTKTNLAPSIRIA